MLTKATAKVKEMLPSHEKTKVSQRFDFAIFP